MDTGDVTDREASQQVTVYTDPAQASIQITQIIPDEFEEEGFTYYDEKVQDRLAYTLLQQQKDAPQGGFTLENPLAILNPFGTGSNGLYLYFHTDVPTQVRYTVHVEGGSVPDYTAAANNQGKNGYSRLQEFLLIGLVPGEENTVTLQTVTRQGREEEFSFTISMPESLSGFESQLEYEDGDVEASQLSQGLYYAMGLGDYYGYTFFFDNSGVLRYELVMEGYHADRFLWDGDGSLITCVGGNKIARFNRFGQVTQVFDLGEFELHHDINWGPEGTLLALATDTRGETVEDQVLQVDLETGEVAHIVDFTQVFQSYFDITRPVQATDPLRPVERRGVGLAAPELPPIHRGGQRHHRQLPGDLHHHQVRPGGGAGDPVAGRGPRLLGGYGLCGILSGAGGGLPLPVRPARRGAHDHRGGRRPGTAPAGEGQLYLRVYDNNYYAMSSRDDFQVEVSEEVSTSSTIDGDANSHVYFYLVDEAAGTFSLCGSFDLPYSSLVSNAQWRGDTYMVNNGVHQCFEEYTLEGGLIRRYNYTCTANGYRVMKGDFEGFWFLRE